MIDNLVRKNILKLKPYTSARDSFSSGILLDANENSLGSVGPNDELQLNRYPDPAQKELRKSLADYLKVSEDKLFFGVGSDEIIDLLIRIFCEPGVDNVIIPEPTYGMYKVACDVNNIKTISVPLNKNFQLGTDLILKNSTPNSKLLFLCSPNNPTGNALNPNAVKILLKEFKGIIVIDEAYIEFCEEKSFIDFVDEFPNLIITRTFSKAWGLAGIRCGYSIANYEITKFLFKIKAPYNLNKLTANTVLQAIKDNEKKENFVKTILTEKERIINELEKIDSVEKTLPSDANFVTFKIENAIKIFNRLVEKGIIIRNRSNQLNLENCLRLTIGIEEENNKFLSALRELI